MLRLARPEIEAPEKLLCPHDPSVCVGVLGGGADHVLLVDPPGLLGEHAHEVTPTTRADKHPEPVRLQVLEQLEHRLIDQLDVRDSQLRLLHRLQPLAHLRVELLRRRARPRPHERREQGIDHVRLLRRNPLEELWVSADDRLVGLLLRQ